MFCKVKNCRYPFSHATKRHKCGKCKIYGHGVVECNNLFLKTKLKEYYNDELPLDSQCSVLNCEFSKFHTSEAHECTLCNQIGHAEYECPKIEFFKIDCPLCSKINVIEKNQSKIFGLEEKCKVCKDNVINIFLPDCGHACLCNECFNEIKEN